MCANLLHGEGDQLARFRLDLAQKKAVETSRYLGKWQFANRSK